MKVNKTKPKITHKMCTLSKKNGERTRKKHKMEMTFEKVKWKSVNKFAHTIEDKCSLSLSRLNEFLLNCNAKPWQCMTDHIQFKFDLIQLFFSALSFYSSSDLKQAVRFFLHS